MLIQHGLQQPLLVIVAIMAVAVVVDLMEVPQGLVDLVEVELVEGLLIQVKQQELQILAVAAVLVDRHQVEVH
jgi:hypothetical protein